MSAVQRKKAMRSNRGRTRPERRLAAAIWRLGFRYLTAEGYQKRRGGRLPGNADLIFVGKRVAVFFDGCFWHGCRRCHDFANDCNIWWQKKIDTNIRRDRRVRAKLRRQGWLVVRVWEHEVRDRDRFASTIKSLAKLLHGRG